MDYSQLDPQQVLDALDAVSLRGDGRVLQLNSYENRVFQVFLEDGGAVVAKFYRPGRWADAQIVEEHGYALELAAAEVPVVPPLVLAAAADAGGLALRGDPTTLACLETPAGVHRYAVAQRCAGREPELEDPATLRQLGRFIGRLHAVGARQPFAHRHHLDARRDGRRALATLLEGGHVTDAERPAWRNACEQALAA
ncbi:MAG: phosphotransferase, partial [Burkholderiales bacterium]|nr:phosphotransferase [Burkholderiales bacterium]